MDPLKQFVIPFSGLEQGIHEYAFTIDRGFFEAFDYSEIKNGSVNLKFTLDKQAAMLTLVFDFKGTVNVMCDRCADYFDLPLEGKQKLYVKFSDRSYEESEEIITIPETEHEINIAHYIYEFVNLLLPIKRIHPDDQCNDEMLHKLDELSVADKNDKQIDPRWKALIDLKD